MCLITIPTDFFMLKDQCILVFGSAFEIDRRLLEGYSRGGSSVVVGDSNAITTGIHIEEHPFHISYR